MAPAVVPRVGFSQYSMGPPTPLQDFIYYTNSSVERVVIINQPSSVLLFWHVYSLYSHTTLTILQQRLLSSIIILRQLYDREMFRYTELS